jgi:DNA-binding response OmpR family regulator
MSTCPPSPARKRILVVDDQPFVALVIRVNLAREQYEVLSCQDPVDVLRRFETLAPDLLILDLCMPVLNGVELCRRIRLTRTGERVPIIMMTGHGDSASEEEALQAGVSAFMTKPFSPRALAETVARLLAGNGGDTSHAV